MAARKRFFADVSAQIHDQRWLRPAALVTVYAADIAVLSYTRRVYNAVLIDRPDVAVILTAHRAAAVAVVIIRSVAAPEAVKKRSDLCFILCYQGTNIDDMISWAVYGYSCVKYRYGPIVFVLVIPYGIL